MTSSFQEHAIPRRSSTARYLLLILILALAGRAALLRVAWRNDSAALSIDSREYVAAATSLATQHTFETNGHPEIRRTPGYPLFLAVCGLTGPLGYGIAQLMGMLLDVLLVYLTYLLGARLVNATAGLWAAAPQALSAVAIGSRVRILLLARHFSDGKWWPVGLAAALTAAAIYVRPVGTIFVPMAVAALLFRPRRLVNAGGFVLMVGLLLAPWSVRNHVVAGYRGFSSIGD